jgi:GNAT superfamily N-acetyltransferase
MAFAAKGSWGYPGPWMESWRAALTISPEFITTHETWVAVTEGRAIGFHALVAREGSLWLEHLWIEPARMGQGVGCALFQHAVERARALGFAALEIESDPNATGFYLRMGARQIGVVTATVEGQTRELPRLIYPVPPGPPMGGSASDK